MALKRLSTEEMVQISGPWVTAKTEAREAISGTPELVGLLPRIEAAHKALHDAQPVADARDAELQAQAAKHDARHDVLVRGVYDYLTAVSALTEDQKGADEVIALRDYVLPAGLQTAQKSYVAEAGAAELLRTRLASDPDTKKRLKAIVVIDKKTLWSFVEEWMDEATKLGAIEEQRGRLKASAGPSDGAKNVAARNQWIRAVGALLAMAELAELSEANDGVIFGGLRMTEKRADRRGSKVSPDAPASPEPSATPPATPPATPG